MFRFSSCSSLGLHDSLSCNERGRDIRPLHTQVEQDIREHKCTQYMVSLHDC